ncbi:MAG: polysaccharide biosynthesis/export family protein [Alistipes sp.]|nr:polysaccharide biosynthesis/export family protein [Alistipes sp.]MEE0864928.1 polysaccharide biosynthesis/export family protein [Alistipes sp.]
MKYFRLFLLAATLLLGACNAQHRVLYLQDIESGSEIALPDNYQLRIKPLDQLTIVVNSKDPLLARPFNSSTSYNSISASGNISSANENSLQIITVDTEGNIKLPIIGTVNCAGLTRMELATLIEEKIKASNYIPDPLVNVRFASTSISIIGEVNKPGRYDIKRDEINILEALALAGDLTIFGSREDVAVIREINGKNVVTKLDLRSSEIFHSPCYHLEQNDIIVVSPNKYKAATSEINQNRSFWISLASTGISLATLLLTILTKR